MNLPVRVIDAFYEAGGEFSVDRSRAEQIHELSALLVGQHTGRIIIRSVKGVRIPVADNPLRVGKVRLPGGDHTQLITGRSVVGEGMQSSVGINRLRRVGGHAVTESLLWVPPRRFGETDSRHIRNMAHEIAHGFGCDHCAKPDCVMAVSPIAPLDELVVPPDIFCSDCVNELERAGSAELARRS